MIIWRDPQKHRKSRPENHAFVLLNYLAWRWSRFTTEITLLNLLLLFFFAFSLLRTKRLIPVHQCTMHTGSFAHLFFQKMKYTLKSLKKKQSFLMEFELKNSRPNTTNFNSLSIFTSLVTKNILRGWNNGRVKQIVSRNPSVPWYLILFPIYQSESRSLKWLMNIA